MNSSKDKTLISIEGVAIVLLPNNEGPISRSLLATFAEYHNDSRKQMSLEDYPELKPVIDEMAQKGIFAHVPQQAKDEPSVMSFSNIYTIQLLGGDENEAALIKLSRPNSECQIDMDYRGITIRAIDKNFFHAFCQIRTRLEQDGLYPICYGASLNVYPSSSLIEESGGLIAYRLPKDSMPIGDDIVDIFSSGLDVIPVSVEEQKAYFENRPRLRLA